MWGAGSLFLEIASWMVLKALEKSTTVILTVLLDFSRKRQFHPLLWWRYANSMGPWMSSSMGVVGQGPAAPGHVHLVKPGEPKRASLNHWPIVILLWPGSLVHCVALPLVFCCSCSSIFLLYLFFPSLISLFSHQLILVSWLKSPLLLPPESLYVRISPGFVLEESLKVQCSPYRSSYSL